MPKAKQLTHRFTVRFPEYLAKEIFKYTLDQDIEYGVLFRLAISKYLREMTVKSDKNNTAMSATKNANSGVSSSYGLPDSSLFGISSPDDNDGSAQWT